MNERKTSFHKKMQRRSGIAALEFLFAAPAFFIMVFFVVEIALTWSDRHIMRLAAYRAARAVVKTRAITGTNVPLCWHTADQGGAQDVANDRIQTAARRASAKIMATVTPSATQLLTMFGTPQGAAKQMDEAIELLTKSDFGDAVSNIAANPYVHAVVRMMKGLPAAWLFTDLKCKDIRYPASAGTTETPGVEITLVYHRPAKMPYVGTIMWLLHWIQQLEPDYDGNSGMIRIDPLTYGINVGMNLGEQHIDTFFNAVQQRTKQILTDTANEIKGRIGSGELLTKSIIFDYIPDSVANATTPSVFGKISGGAFEQILADTNNWRVQDLSNSQRVVNFLADSAVNLLLSAPQELKTIPIQVSVRIPNFNQAYVNQGQVWDNKSFILGSFTGGNKIARLARSLGKTISESDPPNSSMGLPYTTNDDDNTSPDGQN